MIRARMSEEEIKAEAESAWENLKVADYDSVEAFGRVYTYESVLADTRRRAEDADKVEDRALEILAGNEIFDFESMLKQAVEEGSSYDLSSARRTVKAAGRSAAEAAHETGDKFEASAIQRALKIAVDYLTKATKGLVSLSDDAQDDSKESQSDTESKTDEIAASTKNADVAADGWVEVEDMEALEEMDMTDKEAHERSRQARTKERFRRAVNM